MQILSKNLRLPELLNCEKDDGICLVLVEHLNVINALSGYTKKYQEVGLGLALAKKYMDLCHARIEVASEKGVGTTFTLKFRKM